MAEPPTAAPTWKRVVASILDFIMTFFGFGYLVAAATGNLNAPSGFSLDGWPALLLFVLIGVYFYVGRRVAGGTLWDRFFGIKRPQPR